MVKRVRGRLLLVELSLVAFALAHNVAFLLTYGRGVGMALERTGHGAAWTYTVATILAIAGCLIALATWRLAALRRLARDLERGCLAVRDPQRRHLLRILLGLWPVILVLALACFVAMENLERALIGAPVPGLSIVLGADAGPTMLAFGLIALGVAWVAALFVWRTDVLLARVAALRRAARRRPLATMRPPARGTDRRPRWLHRLAFDRRGPPSAAFVDRAWSPASLLS